LLQFLITVTMARQLYPEQYGLVAMLAIFMELAFAFVESGFGSAIIQKQDAAQVHFSSIFYFNVMMGLLMAGLLCLGAPLIAGFYGLPELIWLTWAMSLNLVIGALGSIQINLMLRNLDFKTQTKTNLLSVVLSGILGIAAAYLGLGVWSLVVQTIGATFCRTLFGWLLNSWRPARIFKISALRELFGYGSRLFAAGLIDVIFSNLYQVVIGKIFTAGDLGLYTQASKIKQLPAGSITAIVGRVTFPVFSIIQDDRDRFETALRKAVTFLGMINFPLTVGLAACAKLFVIVLFTEKWISAVPYLQILCVVALFYPLQVINLNVLRATGRADLFLKLEIYKKGLTVANVVIGSHWGITGIVYGQVIVAVICYFMNSYYSGELVNYSSRKQLRDLAPYFLISCLMGVVVYMIPRWINLGDLPLLIVQVVSGAVIYALVCWLLKLDIYMETLDTLHLSINGRLWLKKQ